MLLLLMLLLLLLPLLLLLSATGAFSSAVICNCCWSSSPTLLLVESSDMVQAKEGELGLNQIGYGHDVNMHVCLHACTSIYAILLQCLLMLVDDDDDVNTCDDQGNYADRRGGHLSRDGEAMWVCLHVCIHIETYRASWSVVHVTTDIIHAI